MVISYISYRKFFLVFIFFMSLCFLQAQDIELSSYYKEQLEKKELSLSEREKLIDSLSLLKTIKIDTSELVKIYGNFIIEEGLSELKKILYYSKIIEDIAIATNDYDNNDFKKNHRNRILFLFENKQFYKALDLSYRYLERYPETDKYSGIVYRRLGSIYDKLGDLQKAIDNYDKSIYIFKSFDDYKNIVTTYIDKLKTYVSLEDKAYAEEIYEIKRQIDANREISNIKPKTEVAINLSLGTFYKFMGVIDKSFDAYNKALIISNELEDTEKIFYCLNNLAILHKKKFEYEKAKSLLDKASKMIGNKHSGQVIISNNLADIYQKENNHQKALIYYQKAIVQSLETKEINYQELPILQDLKFSPNKLDILGYLIDKANGWIAYYDAEENPEYLKNALDTFTLADQLIDLIYVESREDLSKLFWRKKGAAFYPKAVEVCYRLQQPEKAFFFMEKNKAMLLLENMTNATAKRLSKLPENILEREQNLIKEIKTLESEIQASTESQKIDSLKNNVFKFKKEQSAFLDSLETEFPKYYNYKKNIKIVTLQNVQATLEADELILQYIVGKEKGFVALISPKTIQLKELPTTEILTETVTQYKEAVSNPFVKNEDKNKYEAVAKKLYQQLIAFNISEMQFAEKRITIIADGLLQYIPFEALRTPNDTYFIENTEIHYNYSLSSAAHSQQNNTPIRHTFIAIAPTRFKNDQFTALATSKEELEKLTTIFNANHFQYEKATKTRFSEAYGNYKIMHLSTHGGIENTVPWMAFYDETMTLDELYFTKNQSELVVLSACKTSDGELKKGEGVMSLARGFFNAGAKSVVSSLWDINEKASNDIIQEFYKNIAAGDTKSSALQKAKLSYIKNNKNTSEASPYYWSALTITGDVSPIYEKQNGYLYYIIGGLFLTGIILYTRSKRKKQAA